MADIPRQKALDSTLALRLALRGIFEWRGMHFPALPASGFVMAGVRGVD